MSDNTPQHASSPLRCTATRAKDGQPCQAWAVTGRDLCAGHAGLGKLDHKAASAKSAAVRRHKAERRKLSLLDLIAERLETKADTIVQAYEKAGAEGDWRAFEALITRVHGKPTERIETTEIGSDPRLLSVEQRAELRRRLVAEHPELLELRPKGEAA